MHHARRGPIRGRVVTAFRQKSSATQWTAAESGAGSAELLDYGSASGPIEFRSRSDSRFRGGVLWGETPASLSRSGTRSDSRSGDRLVDDAEAGGVLAIDIPAWRGPGAEVLGLPIRVRLKMFTNSVNVRLRFISSWGRRAWRKSPSSVPSAGPKVPLTGLAQAAGFRTTSS